MNRWSRYGVYADFHLIPRRGRMLRHEALTIGRTRRAFPLCFLPRYPDSMLAFGDWCLQIPQSETSRTELASHQVVDHPDFNTA